MRSAQQRQHRRLVWRPCTPLQTCGSDQQWGLQSTQQGRARCEKKCACRKLKVDATRAPLAINACADTLRRRSSLSWMHWECRGRRNGYVRSRSSSTATLTAEEEPAGRRVTARAVASPSVRTMRHPATQSRASVEDSEGGREDPGPTDMFSNASGTVDGSSREGHTVDSLQVGASKTCCAPTSVAMQNNAQHTKKRTCNKTKQKVAGSHHEELP